MNRVSLLPRETFVVGLMRDGVPTPHPEGRIVDEWVSWVNRHRDRVELHTFHLQDINGAEVLPHYDEDSGECIGFAFAKDVINSYL